MKKMQEKTKIYNIHVKAPTPAGINGKPEVDQAREITALAWRKTTQQEWSRGSAPAAWRKTFRQKTGVPNREWNTWASDPSRKKSGHHKTRSKIKSFHWKRHNIRTTMKVTALPLSFD
jgi:hypothetical protein